MTMMTVGRPGARRETGSCFIVCRSVEWPSRFSIVKRELLRPWSPVMNRLGRQVLIPGALGSSMPPLKEQSKYYESGLLKTRQFEPFRSELRRHFRDGHQAERKLRLPAGMVNAGVSALYAPMG